MAARSGKAGTVTWNGEVVGHVISWSTNLEGDAIDVTGMTEAGVAAFIGGVTRGTCDFECFLDTTTAVQPDEMDPVTSATLALADGVNTISGTAIITSAKPTVAVDGAVKWSCSAQFTGAITIA